MFINANIMRELVRYTTAWCGYKFATSFKCAKFTINKTEEVFKKV